MITPERRAAIEACSHLVWFDCLPGRCSGCSTTEEELRELGRIYDAEGKPRKDNDE